MVYIYLNIFILIDTNLSCKCNYGCMGLWPPIPNKLIRGIERKVLIERGIEREFLRDRY